ncbi:MAG TPA: type II secretion system protein [Bacillota bacterium]
MDRFKREDGFTLVETITVLAVLVLLYSLTLQGIGRSHQRLVEKADLQQITGDLQLLQIESKMKPGYTLQAVFYPPAASGGGCRYRLDFGYQAVDREVRGLRLAGEAERRIVLCQPEPVEEGEEDAGGGQRLTADGEDSSFLAKEICLVGSMQREYLLVVRSGGELEVLTR